MSTASAWTAYCVHEPPRHVLVRFLDDATGRQWTQRTSHVPPMPGTAYLWWKLTRLGRMELEGELV